MISVEASPQNFQLLEANIRNNGYQGRIIALRKAVTDGRSVMMDIDAPETGQMRVSAHYRNPQGTVTEVPGISLAQIINEFHLTHVDLLKIDCEGGEYTILLTLPHEVLAQVRNIIFEYHEIDNFTQLLADVRERLDAEGFDVSLCGRGKNLIRAIHRNLP